MPIRNTGLASSNAKNTRCDMSTMPVEGSANMSAMSTFP